MLYQKLIGLLKSLDKTEVSRLDKYLHSPFFAVNPQSVALFDYLVAFHPVFPKEKITARLIARAVKKLSTVAHRDVAGSRLLSAIENFMAYEAWQRQPREVKRSELVALRQHGLHEQFDRQHAAVLAALDKHNDPNIDILYEKHLLTEMGLNGFAAKQDRSAANSILPVLDTLDRFHALKKLRYLCEAINRKTVTGVDYGEPRIAGLLQTLQPLNNEQHPYVYLFVNVLHLLRAASYSEFEKHHQQLKKFIRQRDKEPLSDSLREAHEYAYNSNLLWYNLGWEKAGDEYLWWMEWRKRHGLLPAAGQLQGAMFRNIITISVAHQRKPLAIRNIITTYGRLLPASEQETLLPFAEGLYYYAVRDAATADRYFLQARAKSDVVLSATLRRWQWISLYDCHRGNPPSGTLLSQLSAFERFLQRHHSELQHVEFHFRSFIHYAKALLNTVDGEELSRLQSDKHFAGKHWLLDAFEAKAKPRLKQRLAMVG